jgi:hypothetical protein
MGEHGDSEHGGYTRTEEKNKALQEDGRLGTRKTDRN